MLSEGNPIVRQLIRLMALPYCYVKLVNWNVCKASKIQVIMDFMYMFLKLKNFPDNYSPCRMWELERKEWPFYYGSLYNPYQRNKVRKNIQPFEYLILFDNKEICEYICRSIDVKMPLYFGVISPNMNYSNYIGQLFKKHNLKSLIVKPVTGQSGLGIVLAYKKDDKILIQIGKHEIALEKFKLREKSILQEYISQEETLSQFSEYSVNTIRILTLYTRGNEPIVLSALMRFGVGKSYIDNWSAGGVAVGVDVIKGQLKKIGYDKKGNTYRKHPITNIEYNGFKIVNWDKVLKLAEKVQGSFPYFKMLGLDVALGFDGKPVLIEINPSPDLILQEQTAGPLLKNKRNFIEFKKYDLLINKIQLNLY